MSMVRYLHSLPNRQASISDRRWISETDIAGVGHLGAIRMTVRYTLIVFIERDKSFVGVRTLTGIGGLQPDPPLCACRSGASQ